MPAPKDFVQMLRDLRRDVDALKRQSPLHNSGLSVTDAGELTMSGNLIVTGDFTAQGKISNEALVSPIRTDAAGDFNSGFALTATGSTPLASQTWTVPDGMTRLQAVLISRLFAQNGSGVTDYLNCRPRIDVAASGASSVGQSAQVEVAAGKAGLNVGVLSVAVVDVLPGSTITVMTEGWTNGSGGWPANGVNFAEISGSLIWTR